MMENSEDHASYFGSRPSFHQLKYRGYTDPFQKYKCHICRYTTCTQFNLTAHIRTHTGERPFSCPIYAMCLQFEDQSDCLPSAANAHSLKRTGYRNRQLKYQCHVCGYSTTRRFNLVMHIRTHTGEKPHCCSYCNKHFRRQCDLNRHILIHIANS